MVKMEYMTKNYSYEELLGFLMEDTRQVLKKYNINNIDSFCNVSIDLLSQSGISTEIIDEVKYFQQLFNNKLNLNNDDTIDRTNNNYIDDILIPEDLLNNLSSRTKNFLKNMNITFCRRLLEINFLELEKKRGLGTKSKLEIKGLQETVKKLPELINIKNRNDKKRIDNNIDLDIPIPEYLMYGLPTK
ncbi:MAG: hypothetical protein KA885_06335, partial [Spirochaetes bacterium]|nr:hypothetical protein [Spirochaetota bacterium]